MFDIRIMIHPIEIIIIIFVGLSAMDMAERYKLGSSHRELKKLKGLNYFEKNYVKEYDHFFKPEIWHWAALMLGALAVIRRVL